MNALALLRESDGLVGDVRRAVLNATFEALVGFQLNDAQLRYNATR